LPARFSEPGVVPEWPRAVQFHREWLPVQLSALSRIDDDGSSSTHQLHSKRLPDWLSEPVIVPERTRAVQFYREWLPVRLSALSRIDDDGSTSRIDELGVVTDVGDRHLCGGTCVYIHCVKSTCPHPTLPYTHHPPPPTTRTQQTPKS